jgi:8-oxo-dGTP pyrophosphatase MutT (NUDIX family)
MSWEPGLDDATVGPCGPRGWRQGPHDRAAARTSLRAEAAVLALLDPSGRLVLLARKRCGGGPWSCDAALPGGRIEEGEDEAAAALREAWEEAWVHPSMVSPVCLGPLHSTSRGGVIVRPVVAVARGPLCPRPSSGELDRVAWVPLEGVAGARPRVVRHPRGRAVVGVELAGGFLVWGLTLRILQWLYSALPLLLPSIRMVALARVPAARQPSLESETHASGP